jgi:IS30 family transposase
LQAKLTVNNLLNIAVPFLILWYGLPLTRKTIGIIADNIGVNKSTISRELAQRSYRHKQANGLSCQRQSVPKYQKWNCNIQQIVNSKLRLQWSLI